MPKSDFKSPCIIITFIAVCSLSSALNSQCNPPGQMPSPDCATAPVTCLQNACYTMTNFIDPGHNGWCGPNTNINNPEYFKFIAMDDHVQLIIQPHDCQIGNMIQAGLLAGCSWDNGEVLDCDPGTPVGGSIDLSALVTPGEMYWLMIDGVNGAVCGYTISQVVGIAEVDIPGELNQAETYADPPALCQGYDSLRLVTSPMLPEAHGYYWTFSWWPDAVTTTLNENFLEFTPEPPAGEHTFCVRAFSGCDTTNEVCQTFIVLPGDTIEKQSILCPEEFPFVWGSITITDPGIYLQTFADSNGCITDTIWVIESYPEHPVDTTTYIFCGLPDHEVPGTYTLTYQDVYGCDSIAVIIIIDGEIDAIVDLTCEAGEFILQPYIQELAYPNDELEFAWYTCDYCSLLYEGSPFTTISPGCYCLVVSGLFCQDTTCITITEESCVEECGLVDDFYCFDEEVVFTLPWPVSAEAEITWRIYENNQLIESIEGETTFTRTFDPDVYEVTLSVLDSGVTTACQEAFVVEDIPFATICCDEVVCDSCTFITIEANNFVNLTVVDQQGFPYLFHDIPGAAEVEICPPSFPYTLTIVEVTGASSGCIGVPGFPDQVTLAQAPAIDIQQSGNALCIEIDNPVAVTWHACSDTITLAAGLCFEPAANGCYCVEVIDANQCSSRDCRDFVSNTIDATAAGFAVFPNPSSAGFSIVIPDQVSLPLEWMLYDAAGKSVDKGMLEENIIQFNWPEHVIPGKYEMVMREGEKIYRMRLVRMGK